jgi:hypothetical protein
MKDKMKDEPTAIGQELPGDGINRRAFLERAGKSALAVTVAATAAGGAQVSARDYDLICVGAGVAGCQTAS